jgi:hypothetical protein
VGTDEESTKVASVICKSSMCDEEDAKKAKQPGRKWKEPSPNKKTTNKVAEVNNFY